MAENTIVVTNSTTSNAATVVQNDTSVAPNLVAASATNRQRIEQLAIEREVWEHGVAKTSNEHLYALLAKCYSLYREMCGPSSAAKALREALEDYANLKGYRFLESTHTLTKIVKCVFGVERRRVSAYSLVLREALNQKLEAKEIAAFINGHGGVEEIRRSKSPTAKTAKQKAELGRAALGSRNLAVIDSSKIAERLDIAKVGNDCVAIVTQQADGTLVVRAIVRSKAVLNAALACAYSESKTVAETDTANSAPANDDKVREQLIAKAA
jgi:hypothetical protein